MNLVSKRARFAIKTPFKQLSTPNRRNLHKRLPQPRLGQRLGNAFISKLNPLLSRNFFFSKMKKHRLALFQSLGHRVDIFAKAWPQLLKGAWKFEGVSLNFADRRVAYNLTSHFFRNFVETRFFFTDLILFRSLGSLKRQIFGLRLPNVTLLNYKLIHADFRA